MATKQALLCIFVGIVHSALCDISHALPTPAPCCQPMQMEGMATVLNGPAGGQTYLFVSDYKLNKTLSKNADASQKGWILDDLNANKRYESDGTNCVWIPAPISREARARCIPSTATYLGQAYIGPQGVLPYNSYEWTVGDVKESIAVSQTGCMPIIQKLESPSIGGEFIEMFENVKPSISDPSVFNIDTSKCVPKSSLVG